VIGWFGIVRLGLVQTAIGAMVMLSTSLLNRVMVVEYALAAAVPSALVAWHYAVQLARPLWGHGSDRAARRTPWIVGGMGVLALGSLLAVNAVPMLGAGSAAGIATAILAYTFIGAGVGAAGTSLLALLASIVAPERRAAAAALTWIMMVAGIAVSAGIAGSLLDPFSLERLALVSGGLVLIAFLLTIVAVAGLERRAVIQSQPPGGSFAEALREMRSDPRAVRFTLFVFVSMLAYSMQDLILEPFAGLVFEFSPGESTKLAGIQHGGVMLGMIAAGVGGSFFAKRGGSGDLTLWVFAGCLGSALVLVGLAASASAAPQWPLATNVFLLGLMNGVFAVAAIGTMMRMAGAGTRSKAGVRMGVWGAAQAIAFGAGGMTGAVAADIARAAIGSDASAFALVFAAEAALFLWASWLALRMTGFANQLGQQGGFQWKATTQS
jgi:BCD family chlorophyll transporter-like MFS transporter